MARDLNNFSQYKKGDRKMNWRIVRALIIKYAFVVSRNNFPLLDLFFWPVMVKIFKAVRNDQIHCTQPRQNVNNKIQEHIAS